MAESYTWEYLDEAGAPMTDRQDDILVTTSFPTQADAEAWFGTEWSLLADAGVAAVTLRRDGEVVYGPMPLSA